MRVRRVWRAWLCGWCSGSVSPGTLLAVDGSDSMLSLPGVQAKPVVRELRSYMPHSKIKKKKKSCQPLSFLLVQREQLEH